MAGNTAYSGILAVLDILLEEKKKGCKDPERRPISWYKQAGLNRAETVIDWVEKRTGDV